MRNEILRSAVRSRDGVQKKRIKNENVIRSIAIKALFPDKLGSGGKLKEEEKGLVNNYMTAMIDEFNSLQPKIKTVSRYNKRAELVGKTKYIKDYLTYAFIEAYLSDLNSEELFESIINRMVENEPIYTEYLKNITGCGPIMSAVILSEFDLEKSRHVSSFWKYAGFDVVTLEDGTQEGRGKKEAHLVMVEYVDKATGKTKKKKSISYNAFLKTKLMGVLADSFIRKGGEYRTIYDNYKHRLQSRVAAGTADYKPGHINMMAKRYMIKMFLKDLWVKWRELSGYPVEPDYWEEYISGRSHSESLKLKELAS